MMPQTLPFRMYSWIPRVDISQIELASYQLDVSLMRRIADMNDGDRWYYHPLGISRGSTWLILEHAVVFFSNELFNKLLYSIGRMIWCDSILNDFSFCLFFDYRMCFCMELCWVCSCWQWSTDPKWENKSERKIGLMVSTMWGPQTF